LNWIPYAVRRGRNDLRECSVGIPGGKHHVMPCHHSLAEALRTHIGAAGIAEDPA
jgi:hypothetical protein